MGKQMMREVEEISRQIEPRMTGAKIHKYRGLIANLGGIAHLFDDNDRVWRKEFDRVKKEIYELMDDELRRDAKRRLDEYKYSD